jgi:N-acylglucosamine 2-epimerase
MFENINTDGGFDLDSCEGRFINPGHGLESMWFILQHAEKTGNSELIKRACEYIEGLFEFGLDAEYGGIYYFMDALGKPHLELQWDMKLWWPHNEALIAALYAYRLSGEERFMKRFESVDEWTWKHFPDPEFGEWYGYLNRRGEPTHTLKGGKWKTFFHLPRFLLTSIQQMKQIQNMS